MKYKIKQNYKHYITKRTKFKYIKVCCLPGISITVNNAVSLHIFSSYQNQSLNRELEGFTNLNSKDLVTHCLRPSQGTVT